MPDRRKRRNRAGWRPDFRIFYGDATCYPTGLKLDDRLAPPGPWPAETGDWPEASQDLILMTGEPSQAGPCP